MFYTQTNEYECLNNSVNTVVDVFDTQSFLQNIIYIQCIILTSVSLLYVCISVFVLFVVLGFHKSVLKKIWLTFSKVLVAQMFHDGTDAWNMLIKDCCRHYALSALNIIHSEIGKSNENYTATQLTWQNISLLIGKTLLLHSLPLSPNFKGIDKIEHLNTTSYPNKITKRRHQLVRSSKNAPLYQWFTQDTLKNLVCHVWRALQ